MQRYVMKGRLQSVEHGFLYGFYARVFAQELRSFGLKLRDEHTLAADQEFNSCYHCTQVHVK